MTPATVEKIFAFTMLMEGGSKYTTYDVPTKYGVTLSTLRAFRDNPKLAASDVENLTEDEARKIYMSRYLLPFMSLPDGLALICADHGYNCSPDRSARLLQTVLHVDIDGKIGNETLGAARLCDQSMTIERLAWLQKNYYNSLDKPQYIHGWLNRCNARSEAALELVC